MKNVLDTQSVLVLSGYYTSQPQQAICYSLVLNRFRAKFGGNNRTKSNEND